MKDVALSISMILNVTLADTYVNTCDRCMMLLFIYCRGVVGNIKGAKE